MQKLPILVALKCVIESHNDALKKMATGLKAKYDYDVFMASTVEELKAFAEKNNVDGALITNHTPLIDSVMTALPNIKWLQNCWTGCEKVTQSKALLEKKAQVTLTNNRGSSSIGLTEFVIGTSLYFLKRFREFDAQRKKGEWVKDYPGFPHECLRGKTIGIVGAGKIGASIANACKYGFNMKVLAIKRDPTKVDDLKADKVMGLQDLKVLCSESDIIVSVLPGTASTVGLFNYEIFKTMKPSAIFINIGRGVHVVQDDLIRALRENVIRNAALDVTDPEPLPSSSPFFTDPVVSEKVFLGFHEADTCEGYQDIVVQMVYDQIVRYSKGEKLENIVNIDEGY